MTAIVPNHGGTPVEMLRDLADFLDNLDDVAQILVFRQAGHPLDGKSLFEIFNPDEDGEPPRTMQADVRWLADRLDENDSEDER